MSMGMKVQRIEVDEKRIVAHMKFIAGLLTAQQKTAQAGTPLARRMIVEQTAAVLVVAEDGLRRMPSEVANQIRDLAKKIVEQIESGGGGTPGAGEGPNIIIPPGTIQ